MRGKDRREQEAFSKFKAYYSFEARFCNPGSGHEKGGVEGLVGMAQGTTLVPVPEAGSLEELNERSWDSASPTAITRCPDKIGK